MSAWKKAMSYLGLGPDDAYDDYDAPYEPERPAGRAPRQPAADPMDSGAVRTIPVRTASGRPERERERELPPRMSADYDDQGTPRRQTSAVRSVPPTSQARPQTIRPASFNQAQEIADRYKDGMPVIMNLEGLDREISRRLIDFASGLCYGLGGAMEKVGSGVYLLTPVNSSLTPDDRRMLGESD